MRSLSWTLIKSDWFPYKRNLETQKDTRSPLAQKKDHVRIQLKGSHLQVKERDLRRNKPQKPTLLATEKKEKKRKKKARPKG